MYIHNIMWSLFLESLLSQTETPTKPHSRPCPLSPWKPLLLYVSMNLAVQVLHPCKWNHMVFVCILCMAYFTGHLPSQVLSSVACV